MRHYILVTVAVLYTASYIDGSYITELTDNNFFDYAKERDFLFVEFYAPWCSDCQKLAPELDKAADTLGTKSADIAKVDCFGAGSGLCQMYGVKSWPQLKTFHRGTYNSDYTGTQTGDAIAMYVESMAGAEAPAVPAVIAQSILQAPYAAPAPVAPGAPSIPVGTVVASKNQKAEQSVGDKSINHAKATIHNQKFKGKKGEGKGLAGKLKKVAGLSAKDDKIAAKETHLDVKKLSQYRKPKKTKRLNRNKLFLF